MDINQIITNLTTDLPNTGSLASSAESRKESFMRDHDGYEIDELLKPEEQEDA